MNRKPEPLAIVTAPGATPKRINKPSVGMDDEITVVYPNPAAPATALTDQVTRREFCARLDGFYEVERVRTKRSLRVVAIAQPDMYEQWLRTRPGGWDGTIDTSFMNDTD